QAQQQHPADFWINVRLAGILLYPITDRVTVGQHRPEVLAEAIGYFRAALALRPRSPHVYGDLGSALWAYGRPAEAEVVLRRALQLSPGFAAAYNNLGNALAAQGRLAEAVDAHRQAIRLKPSHGIYYNLGNTLRKQGKPDEAVAAYRQAIARK